LGFLSGAQTREVRGEDCSHEKRWRHPLHVRRSEFGLDFSMYFAQLCCGRKLLGGRKH
jgi:hypothetical protein